MLDNKAVYEFLERSPMMLCKDNTDMADEYFKFMIKVLESPSTDRFSDHIVRKCIYILQHNICDNTFPESVYLPNYLPVLQKLKDILALRANNDYLTLTINMKASMPIWLYSVEYFIALVSFAFKKSSKNPEETKENEEKGVETIDKNHYEKIIEEILDCYECLLKNEEKIVEKISKGILTEIKRDWFEMDMKLINSLSEVVFPNFTMLNNELLWKLIQILDSIFSFYSTSPFFSEQSSTYGRDLGTNSTISKITLEILFKISDSSEINESEESEPTHANKLNLARLATKKLIHKCKKTIEKYLYDEERNGAMPLPR
jgi:hypothetical protein